MNILAKLIGGSRLYGLSSQDSDVDFRSVFINTEPAKILGLERFDSKVKQNDDEDDVAFELRHFLSLLKKSNTQVMEMLCVDENAFVELDNEFNILVLRQRTRFFDTNYLFSTLRGYIQGEKKRTNGERKGQLGKKRHISVEKYGYSYKNAIHCLRLARTGIEFFKTGRYLVNCRDFGADFYNLLLSIKNSPEKFGVKDINDLIDVYEGEMARAYAERSEANDYVFDYDYANLVLTEMYKKYIV